MTTMPRSAAALIAARFPRALAHAQGHGSVRLHAPLLSKDHPMHTPAIPPRSA